MSGIVLACSKSIPLERSDLFVLVGNRPVTEARVERYHMFKCAMNDISCIMNEDFVALQ